MAVRRGLENSPKTGRKRDEKSSRAAPPGLARQGEGGAPAIPTDVTLTGKCVGSTPGFGVLLAVQAPCAGQRRECLPLALFFSLGPCSASALSVAAVVADSVAVQRPKAPQNNTVCRSTGGEGVPRLIRPGAPIEPPVGPLR